MTQPEPAPQDLSAKKGNILTFLFEKAVILKDKAAEVLDKVFHRSACDLPPPCWAPRLIKLVASFIKPGAAATVKIRVTNGGMNPRAIQIEVAGKPVDTAQVQIAPATVQLSPMEREWVTVTYTAPPDARHWSSREILIWVRGAQNHYARWTIGVEPAGKDILHELLVEDAPDFVHRWSDHFYCNHPLPGGGP
ncbi:MAG TPA: hypothetical protein VFG05_12745 [Methylocella sp.]|nr:hypothetical protein [Methylocella sp.]